MHPTASAPVAIVSYSAEWRSEFRLFCRSFFSISRFSLVEDQLASGSLWIAIDNTRIVGCFLAARKEAVWYISLFGVHPLYRRLGIGTGLLGAVLQEDGLLPIELHVQSDNVGAVKFYEKNGFIRHGEVKDFYQNASLPLSAGPAATRDALWMRREPLARGAQAAEDGRPDG